MAFQNNNQYQQQYQPQQAQPNTAVQTVDYEVDGQNIKLTANFVRQNLVTGGGAVSDKEITMFLTLCKFQKLNPFTGDAYLIKYRSNGKYDAPAQQITSRQAFRKRAEASPHYLGTKSGVIVARDTGNGVEMMKLNGATKMPNDNLIGAWAEVKRDDREWTIHVEIDFNEFAKWKKDYKTGAMELQSTWASMPMNMIVKTAEVNALRQAFPDSLSNLYTEDDKPLEAPVETVDEKPNTVNSLLKKTAKGAKKPRRKVVKDEDVDEQVAPKKQAAKPKAASDDQEPQTQSASADGAVEEKASEAKEEQLNGTQEELFENIGDINR